MKNYSFTGVLLLLVLLATGCSNEKLPAEVPESQNASYNLDSQDVSEDLQ